jgi:HAD superfamily hydrolase (TIGR01490 family)
VSAIVEDFFQQILVHKFYPEAIKLIKDHQSNGRLVILVSNSPEVVVKKIATHLGIEQYLSTRLELINQLYTGKILGEIMYGKQKVISVNSYIQSRNLSLESSWGYGDHDSDIPVLQEVSHPFAVNPTSSLKKIALKNKWPILTFKL